MPSEDSRRQVQLETGLDALGQSLSPDQQRLLLAYVDALERWNRTYNLTAIKDPLQMIGRHLLDSLAVRPWLRGHRILDVGTGAGLPGLPLAVADPQREYVLLDSNGKKTRFVQQAVIDLGLSNVAVERARVEDYRPQQGFDTLVARAFAPLSDMLRITRHLQKPGGRLLAMTGKAPLQDLLARIQGKVQLVPLRVPQVQGERHLVLIDHQD